MIPTQTVESIHKQGELPDVATPPKSGRMWRCGCECRFGTLWHLCRYHQGYNDAVNDSDRAGRGGA